MTRMVVSDPFATCSSRVVKQFLAIIEAVFTARELLRMFRLWLLLAEAS